MMARTIYTMQVRHDGLGKYREIRGYDAAVVQQKADAQVRQWDEMWARRQEAEVKRSTKEAAAREKETKKEIALERTREAQESISDLQSILHHGLAKTPGVDWDSLKDKGDYPEPKPQRPISQSMPLEPQENEPKYRPDLSLINNIFGVGKRKKIEAAAELFKKDHAAWELETKKVEELNEDELRKYNTRLTQWENCRLLWLEEQEELHAQIDKRHQRYLQKDPDGVLDYCDLVLSRSDYPDWFPQQFDIDYIPASMMLIVEYILPSTDQIPTLMEVRYVQARDEFKENRMSDAQVSKVYDDLIYQVTLRVLHELFQADTINAINSAVLNGHVRRIGNRSPRSPRFGLISEFRRFASPL